ncbi:hypothetical protein [Streptosporangium sp. NPDC087985]
MVLLHAGRAMRAALPEQGIPTLNSDVMVMRNGYPTLALPEGLLV